MGIERGFRLFGTRKQTEVLILLGMLEESYPREIARLVGSSLQSVQNYVEKLELSGVLVSRLIGRERRVSFNPRFVARAELLALLDRLADAEPKLRSAAASVRRRPRRRGKEI